jgi:hypothetical protein
MFPVGEALNEARLMEFVWIRFVQRFPTAEWET